MSVTFKLAPLVKVGDLLKSSDVIAQNDAMNSRLRSGLAEPWRIMFLYASLFRQIRNPENGLFPPDLEFFKFYQHLKTSTPWPEAAAGDPAGVNVANSIASFIYGVDGPGIKSESENLDRVPLAVPGQITMPQTPQEHWELAKHQRGAVDLETGVRAAPMLDVGDQFHQLYQGPRSKHGNAFGGYLAGPAPQAQCSEGVVPLAHFLTNTETGAVTSFTTSCNGDFESDTNVSYVYETETSIFVVKIDGSVEIFDRQKYMQGPYTTATTLRKTSAKMIDRVLAMHASEHRGTDAQRLASGGTLENAFDFQRFFSSQYLLAPARGILVDETNLAPEYPIFEANFTGGLPAGHVLKRGASSGYTPEVGFVISSCLVDVTGFLDKVLQLEILSDSTVVETATVTCDSLGAGSAVIKFRTPVPAGSAFSVRLPVAVAPQNSGSVTVEIAELQDYKPRIFDAYAFLRLAGFQEGGDTDGSGATETGAAGIFQRYLTDGNCTNATGLVAVPAAPAAINESGIFETARQLSKVVRIIPRQNLVSYAVADGKSILVFKRNVFGVGFADAFDGLIDIVHTAKPKGWTNQWLMGVEFKTASAFGNNTSDWRPEVYADHFTINNRCIFYSYDLRTGVNKRLGRHVAGVETDGIGNEIGEAPSSFNYAKKDSGNLNSIACSTLDCETNRKNFYKSCRIYEPWPEVESVEAFVVDGEERVRITFKTRLRSTSGESGGAPDVISPLIGSFGTDDINELKAEPFRTDENGIREYLFLQAMGINCCMTTGISPSYVNQPGNSSLGSASRPLNLPLNPSGTFGTCFPDFIFVKLIPTPYEDENNDQDAGDSPVDFSREVQKEIYLRAICEGFVDGKATTDNCANDPGLYAFHYESLNYQAHGKAWPTLLQTPDRTDAPRGFWPLPNTVMRAAKFNEYSKAINLLDRVPLMMPFLVEGRATQRASAIQNKSGIGWPVESPVVTCASGSAYSRALLSPVEQLTLVDTVGSWGPLAGLPSVTAHAGIARGVCGTPSGTWQYSTSSTSLEIRTQPELQDQIFAIPDGIRSMVEGFQTGFTAKIGRFESYCLKSAVSVKVDSETCPPGIKFFDDVNGTGYAFIQSALPVEEVFCEMFSGGKKLDPLTYSPPDGQPAYSPRGDSWFQGASVGSGGTPDCHGIWFAGLNVAVMGGNSNMFLQIPLA